MLMFHGRNHQETEGQHLRATGQELQYQMEKADLPEFVIYGLQRLQMRTSLSLRPGRPSRFGGNIQVHIGVDFSYNSLE